MVYIRVVGREIEKEMLVFVWNFFNFFIEEYGAGEWFFIWFRVEVWNTLVYGLGVFVNGI